VKNGKKNEKIYKEDDSTCSCVCINDEILQFQTSHNKQAITTNNFWGLQ